ncbi:MAG: PrsW family intramembrane metalloprotease [Butyrivibrio sp.]|uniref:PrsW family intramembrane metalloprotease n=1 Tax=Butyrivibrio sp. TaxID=28121 RepID=UPI0025D0DAAB|nr:PrsW family intramembrane metalloprotease [Butyrivibrio sp.]MCR5772435.1 PrsW family intramembrane metalloprotease [Butyrivibrio sp.]
MFYFLVAPYLVYNGILIAAAVIPAIFLMIKVYRSDKLERESPYMLWNLVKAGIFSSLLALLEERILSVILGYTVPQQSPLYNIILYFGIVAFAEESSKYLLMKRTTWKSWEFNCQFDGVVYAVFVSLGFALWENISYVMMYGFGTAIVRAVTAIPGHACFGVFMGIFYGIAKRYDYRRNEAMSRIMRMLAVVIPALLHGAYDYIATMESQNGNGYFIVFVAIMFIISYIMVGKASKADRPI